ncbi:hypothetical protein GE300_03345 [Rhodobacteraceae bacterium 2CG4]|uniref:Lipoprotein n=1 Tax=Halovulum marinum TaxID=2662447 RepID=A0A6L5YY84_9RHOB|nr:hypothetical protein [Halovulum marinum]MSU88654.1 hypothetical protein [Halovulum marinum]
MHRTSLAALVLSAGALAACETAQPQAPTLPVGPGFQVSTIAWADSEATTRIAYALRDNGGRTELCGAIASEGSAAVTTLEPQILNNTRLASGETEIAPGLAYFTRTGSVAEGTPATCVVTEVPWNDAWAETPPQIEVKLEEFSL